MDASEDVDAAQVAGNAADGPDEFDFDVVYQFTEVSDRDEASCTFCTSKSSYPADQLVAIKTRHARNRNGHWLVYCADHFATRGSKGSGTVRTASRREGSRESDIAPVMCPNDFVEVSMTGVCPVCGELVTS